ncbi:uncharacterized protein ACMZJ9_010386 [Mantella aurantiaca]
MILACNFRIGASSLAGCIVSLFKDFALFRQQSLYTQHWISRSITPIMNSPGFILVLLTMMTVWAEANLPPGVGHRIYCETCLATVQGLKKMLNESTGVQSRTKIKDEMKKMCRTFEKESAIACRHLLKSHEEKFVEILLAEKEDTAEAHLCYIHTMACTGIKKKHLQEEKHRFEDGIEEFLQKHADRVRRVKPTVGEHDENEYHKKEEL